MVKMAPSGDVGCRYHHKAEVPCDTAWECLENEVNPEFVMFAIAVSLFLVADVESGLKVGEKIPELKVFGVVGDIRDKSADFARERGEKPTVYLFINAPKFDRPIARYLRELDQKLGDVAENAAIVAVWVGGDLDDNKKRLPLINQSLKFDRTALACFEGAAPGPNGWGLNDEAHLTTVLAHKGKVIKSFAYRSTNEKDVPAILAVMKNRK